VIFKVESLIFDMDGVITDTMRYHYRAWKEVFVRYGVRVSHEDIYKREGQKGIDSVREIFFEHGRSHSDDLGHQVLKEKEELFKEIFRSRFIPGSRSLLRALKLQGFLLGLVTGTSRHEAQTLLPPEMFGAFDAVVCGSDVHNGKPHPEPYEKAIRHLNVKKSRAVVLENAPFGIRSAKAAGLTCFALETSLPGSFLSGADHIFPSYRDMLAKVHFQRP